MREQQARILPCPTCGVTYDKQCKSLQQGTPVRAHASRKAKVSRFIAQEYCRNEYQGAGTGCGTSGCNTCGGES